MRCLSISALPQKIDYLIRCLYALFFLICLFSTFAQAQITRVARIELTNSASDITIGPYLYLTEDPKKILTPQVIINRHQNNLRGTRSAKQIINLGPGSAPLWMIFSVTNNADYKDWILDFGHISGGRTATVQTLKVWKYVLGENEVQPIFSSTSKDSKKAQNGYLPLTFSSPETALLVVYLEPGNALGKTIAPSLKPDETFTSSGKYNSLFSATILIFLVGMTGFLGAIAFLQKQVFYLVFSLYFGINAVCFFWISHIFLESSFWINQIGILIFMSIIAVAVIGSKFFLEITENNHTENIVLGSLMFSIVLCALIKLSLLSESDSTLGMLLAPTTGGAVFLVITFLSFSRGQFGTYGIHHYGSYSIIACAALLTFGLSVSGIIPPNTFYINAWWLSLFPQAIFLVLAIDKKIEMAAEEQKQRELKKSRMAHSMTRLKHSKESADQARLLRVIERERELMSELREREIQRTEEMRQARNMADEANRAKSAFLAVVSHEIRTPMTGILGMVSLLSDTSLNKEQNDYVVAVQKSGETMMLLLNDILDFEKIESGNMDLESIDFDLVKLVQDIVTLMSGQAGEKDIFLKADIPDDFPRYLIGDPNRLRQVLLNLTSNALKFTQKGGVTIQLRATRLALEKNKTKPQYEIYFGVKDTGIGISEDAQQTLFEAFSQTDTSISRKYGGTGLGLAICKRLVEAMGNTIRVTSEENNGSTFFFSILMDQGYQENIEQNKWEDHSTILHKISPMRILIVEDNAMNRKVFRGFLEKQGHHISECESAEQAMEEIQPKMFDAVFTDINLTGMDGTDFVKALRRSPNKDVASLPVIAFTGNIKPKDLSAFYEAGINDMVPKPLSLEKLNEVLEKIKTGNLENPVVVPKSSSPPIAPPLTVEEIPPKIEKLGDPPQPKENEIHADKNVLDSALLLNLVEVLDTSQCGNLIDGFMQKAEEIIQTLQEEKNTEALHAQAHELKGMAANFGFTGLSRLADAIEEKTKKSTDIPPEIAELPDMLRKSKIQLEAFWKKYAETPKSS